MAGKNYYLLTALPNLGQLGEKSPLSLVDLLGQVGDNGRARELLETLFLSDDLLQHQAFDAGESEDFDLSVLTQAQATDQEPLPDYLVISHDDSRQQVVFDHIWRDYYTHVENVSGSLGSRFLQAWLGFEVGLRNALAEARAKRLNLNPDDYMVVADLGDHASDYSRVVNEWSSAGDPFAGLRVLDQARWEWLHENDTWYSFSDDELAAYGAKLMLLRRWERLSDKQPVQASGA